VDVLAGIEADLDRHAGQEPLAAGIRDRDGLALQVGNPADAIGADHLVAADVNPAKADECGPGARRRVDDGAGSRLGLSVPVAVLCAGFGSDWAALTLAVFVSGPTWNVNPVTVTVAVAALSSVPSAHVKVMVEKFEDS